MNTREMRTAVRFQNSDEKARDRFPGAGSTLAMMKICR
jgi:hypothetical protein